MNIEKVLEKYWSIITEEINIKEISGLKGGDKISKTYKPIGSKLSAKFGKDTGKIIQFGKQGNIKEGNDWEITIFDDQNNTRSLAKDEYEIAYEGLEWDNMAIDWEIIAKLDLNITPELQKEWIAREISRFINQMRKEANYNIDQRIELTFSTEEKNFAEIIEEFSDFLEQEALITKITKAKSKPKWDIVALFEYEGKNIEFATNKKG